MFREPTFQADQGALKGNCAPKNPRFLWGTSALEHMASGWWHLGGGLARVTQRWGSEKRVVSFTRVSSKLQGHLFFPSHFSESTQAGRAGAARPPGTQPGCPRPPCSSPWEQPSRRPLASPTATPPGLAAFVGGRASCGKVTPGVPAQSGICHFSAFSALISALSFVITFS